jgi:hypothetical protein
MEGLLLKEQVAQGGLGEDVLDAVLGALEEAAKRAATGVFAIRLVHPASLKDDFSFDRLDNLQDGNIVRVLEEGEPASRTPNGADQPCPSQLLEDLAEEAFRDALLSADDINHGALTRLATGQMHQPQDSIFASARDLHRAT